MTPIEILNTTFALFIAIGTVLSMVALAIRWMVKHYLEEIKHELKPNGGGSIKDQVNRLESRMDEADKKRAETHKKIDNLYTLMIEYIGHK
tara:strand:+ start:461 stop:733 length:273 start_codon:yes stop_codon:yes gene_type:complete